MEKSDEFERLKEALNLTDEQVLALRKISKQGAEPAKLPGISEEQLRLIKKEAESYRAAQRKVTEALGLLWNAQLDAAVTLGRADLVERAIGRPVALWDDCSCNS